MNVFSKYTLENLKKNRTRTIVTIIGIILSVAMFTAVTESIVSGQQYLINSVKATVGAFHAQFSDVTSEQVEKLSKDDDFKEIETLQNIGYAEIGSNNEYKPYLFIGGMSKNFTDMVAVNLIEGRMPEKTDEIVLPRHLYTNGRVNYKLGDVLNLTVGERQKADGITWGDQDFEPDTEKLVATKQRTYTVVGICKRPDTSVERHENPAYMAYTLKEDDSSLSYKAYFTLANPKNLLDSTYTKDEEFGGFINENMDLLTFSGMNTGRSIMPVVYALGAILIAIIMLGSVALIYNSFSISVSERTKQFGLLRSVGATKKQMIRTVLCEALFLCGVAVPLGLLSGCFGIGVTFRLLSSQFAMILGDEVNTNGAVTMKLMPNAYALLIAALISVVTALLSAYIPVKRAMRMSAIEAIRMSNDIKVKGKKLKTSKLSGKLFGFEGMLAQKNFKRNKKKYRTTVISLAMSLILFISASSLCFYFQKTFDMDMSFTGYDISANVFSNNEERAALEEIGKTDGVDESALVAEWDATFIAKEDDVNKTVAENYLAVEGGYATRVLNRYFLNDEAFNKLCKDNGISEKDYYNKSEPMALLYDKRHFESYDETTRTSTYYLEPVFEVKKFPATLNVIELEEKKNGGVCNDLDENGKVLYSKVVDETDIVEFYYNVEECIAKQGIKVGAKLQETPFFLMSSSTVIIYPESMIESVFGKTPDIIYYHGYYKAENYNAVYEKMLKTADSYGEGISITNESEGKDTIKALLTLIKVFSYGFITLISLIAAANVFNTISTNIMLRRRELAMLKSVGMSDKGFRKMMSYESLLYGIKSILLGLPLSLVITYLIYYVVSDSGYDMSFTLPFGNIIFALVSVMLVVFASMIYSVKKLKKYNTADELKNENL